MVAGLLEEPKGKSRREGSVKEEMKTDRHREDRKREKERNGERHKGRDRDRDSRHEREKSVDEKGRDRDRDSRHEREKSVDERERSVDDKHRERDRDSRHERERSVDDKHRDRDRDSRHERETSVDDKHRDREKHKSKRREKDRGLERAKSRDDERSRDKGKSREKDRDDRDREKDTDKEKEKARDRVRSREKEREREKERDREKEREREKEKERDRYAERERERERERDRRERERDRERERKEREKLHVREKRRDMDRSYSSDEDVRDHGRKRRRREEDHQSRDVEQSSKGNRHRDGSHDSGPRKKGDGDSEVGNEKTREDELAEEQKRLDEEMEKRRRRVQEWQELRRRREEIEQENLGVPANHEPNSGKTWTLEGESDDEEAGSDGKLTMDVDEDGNGAVEPIVEGDNMSVDLKNEVIPTSENGGDNAVGDDEIDPLDAFMNSMVLPEVEKLNSAPPPPVPNDSAPEVVQTNGKPKEILKRGISKSMGRIIPGENSDSDYGDLDNDENPSEDEDDEEFMKRVKKTKVEKLSIVDHSKIDYPPFRKNFYIEVKDISRMTSEDVASYRKELELKIHGKDVPKPIKTWHQTGLSNKILDTIKKLDYEKPMPIQAQAIPIIMSGRDCIGVAKTGSGKTLAFVLPMLRHIKDQPPLESGDGPIGLIMAPTRELVQQIHSDIKKFTKAMGVSCVPVYGGSGVAQQISELKRGAEIVVCTPGRMIDILCTSGGKITNLRRVTYLVMDEADRMFDMGFEPQITRIVQNTRPDRQTVLFSATFPRQVEILARKVLNKPVEIQVGGRSVVNKDITQQVEVRPDSDRFLRLLELLGEWYEKGKILIFVQSQEKCDSLFRDLLRSGYPCLSLHGAKDQTDRESTITDFKSNVCNLLIATSIAARGLDVKDLELVINFDAPNHYEDYVHRVGRTGRAGKKGYAITFISEDDARYAPDLVKALELSEQSVPSDLKALADGFMAKVNQGLEQAHGTGYGGSGFKFNEEEDEVRKAAKKAQAKEYGFEEDKSDSDDEDEGIRKAGGDISHQAALAAFTAAATKATVPSVPTPISVGQAIPNGGLPVSLPSALGLTIPGVPTAIPGAGLPVGTNDGAARAAALAAAMNLQHNLAKIQADAMPEHYEAELEINDFPQNARWKVTHKETLGPISEWTGAAITTRGQYYPPGKIAGHGERKLYLFIEGPTEQSVKRAKAELKRVLEDITNQASSLPGSGQPGRYSVV